MKRTLNVFLSLFLVTLLSGCGMDLAQIYILFKEQGAMMFNPAMIKRNERGVYGAQPGQANGVSLVQSKNLEVYKSKIAAIAENNKKYTASIAAKYGPEAGKEVSAITASLEMEVLLAAQIATTETDFNALVNDIFKKYNQRISAALAKYKKEKV